MDAENAVNCLAYLYGWPELDIYIVHDRIFGDFPAKSTVYTPCIYGSGQQPYILACRREYPALLCTTSRQLRMAT